MNRDWRDTGVRGREGTDDFGYVKRTPENRLGKKPMGKGRYVLTMLLYLSVTVFVIALGTALYVWIDGAIAKNAATMITASDVASQFNVNVLYSQEDLDARLLEASQAAEASKAQAVADAEKLARDEILGGIRTSLEDGTTMVETLRPFYPGELVLVSNGTFHFVPIREDLIHNAYTQDGLEVLESGEYRYQEDGQVISHKGIDVSQHQGEIDWEKVAADGVEFALIRTGYRGYGTGKLVEDTFFEKNLSGAQAAGIKAGVYIFTQAVTADEIQEEADELLAQIAPYSIEGPVVIDVEKTADSSGRMNQLTVEERTALVLQFCQIIENAGYKPMIYHNMEMGVLMLDLGALEGYDKWFASYSEQLYYPYAYDIWQYSNTGSVDGIKGDVDLNISFSEFWNE